MTIEKVAKELIIKQTWMNEIIRRMTSYKMTEPLRDVLDKLSIDDLKTLYGYMNR